MRHKYKHHNGFFFFHKSVINHALNTKLKHNKQIQFKLNNGVSNSTGRLFVSCNKKILPCLYIWYLLNAVVLSFYYIVIYVLMKGKIECRNKICG